jgi:hypothetical protein
MINQSSPTSNTSCHAVECGHRWGLYWLPTGFAILTFSARHNMYYTDNKWQLYSEVNVLVCVISVCRLLIIIWEHKTWSADGFHIHISISKNKTGAQIILLCFMPLYEIYICIFIYYNIWNIHTHL